MSVVFIRAIILYLLLIFSVRLMGKHQIGELQPSELAITILISNIATLPVEDMELPLLTGIIPIITLASLDVIMSWLGVKSRRLRKLTCGMPAVIISNGVIDQAKMKEIRFTADDLMEALHSKDIFDINEVQFAVVETTGAVSVYQKYPYRTVSNQDMKNKGNSSNPPEVVVDDGIFAEEAIKRINSNKEKIKAILAKDKIQLKDVFIMTMDSGGKYTVIKKERAR